MPPPSPAVRARRKRRACLAGSIGLLAWALALCLLLRAMRRPERTAPAAAPMWRAGAVRIDAGPSASLCGSSAEHARAEPSEDFANWRVDARWAPPAHTHSHLRVAVFTGAYSHIRDGVSLTLNRLVAFLLQCGHDVLVLAPISDNPALQHAGRLFPVPSLPAPGRPDYRVSLGLTSHVRNELASFNPNLVHIATPDMLGFSAQNWASESQVPVVCSYHTHFAYYLHYYHLQALVPSSWRILQFFYNSCKHTYVPTQGVAKELASHGITSSELRVWGRGLDYSAFNPSHRCERWRNAVLGVSRTTPVLLLVCRLVWEKALDVFAETVQQLQRRGVLFKPAVVGDGPALQGLSHLIPEASYLGSLSGADLARAYASSDVFLFPSRTETFGITTLEAMGSGLPVIVSNSSASIGMVQSGDTGYIVHEQTASAYASTAKKLLEDRSLRQRMGDRARQYAIEHYQWGKALRELLDNYERAAIDSEEQAGIQENEKERSDASEGSEFGAGFEGQRSGTSRRATSELASDDVNVEVRSSSGSSSTATNTGIGR